MKEAKTQLQGERNGLFLKLATISFCLAGSSSISYWISFLGGRLAHYEGSPSDEAILYCFLYGLVLSQIITIFLPRGNMKDLFSFCFIRTFFSTFFVVASLWTIIAWGGSELAEYLVYRTPPGAVKEAEWYQISLVLISAGTTFLLWDRTFHKNR